MKRVPTDPPTPPLRRLSQRLGLWRLRYAATQHWDSFAYAIGMRFWPLAAPLYRPMLRHTTFIGVTGSCGKSTTRSLIEAIVGGARSAKIRPGANLPYENAHVVWTTRLRDRFAVAEVAVGKRGEPGTIRRSARIVRPRIAVVTNIADDHIWAFGSREAIAQEKGALVEELPPEGVAVLNADDPLVMAMRSRCKGRVLTYGLGEDAMLRAVDIRSRWPQTLSFVVVYEGRSVPVTTRLCGKHFVGCALAAIAGAVAAGVPLEQAAQRIAVAPPFFARMEPSVRGDGVTFVRDDIKAPLWTLPATFDFLATAQASRRILVVGTISDYTGESRRVYVGAARQALAVAEHVVFVGTHASKVLRARRHARDNALQAFNTLEAAHEHLSRLLQAGDLVVLKGSQNDHLYLLMLDRFPGRRSAPASAASAREPAQSGDSAREFIVVGLGNPGARYDGTRHNVGKACVDRLATRLSADWRTEQHARVATAQHGEVRLQLVKLDAAVNDTGPALRHVCAAYGVPPARCILVHDDVDLPVGRFRGRLEGGGGGHKGVRSVLETFEDNAFPRVKLGIGRPAAGIALADYVLQPFAAGESEAMAAALDAGADQVLLLVSEIEARARRAGEAASKSPPAVAA